MYVYVDGPCVRRWVGGAVVEGWGSCGRGECRWLGERRWLGGAVVEGNIDGWTEGRWFGGAVVEGSVDGWAELCRGTLSLYNPFCLHALPDIQIIQQNRLSSPKRPRNSFRMHRLLQSALRNATQVPIPLLIFFFSFLSCFVCYSCLLNGFSPWLHASVIPNMHSPSHFFLILYFESCFGYFVGA